MSPDRTLRYTRSPDAALKTVGSGVALFVRERRALHVLNPTARALWECLEEPATFDQLVARLERRTDGDAATIAADLEPALAEFVALGLVEAVG